MLPAAQGHEVAAALGLAQREAQRLGLAEGSILCSHRPGWGPGSSTTGGTQPPERPELPEANGCVGQSQAVPFLRAAAVTLGW